MGLSASTRLTRIILILSLLRYWMDFSARWRGEQDSISARTERLKDANRDYIDQSIEVLELSEMTHSLYLQSNGTDKRKLLGMVLSNWQFDGATLSPIYRKPFDNIAEGVQSGNKRALRNEFLKELRSYDLDLLHGVLRSRESRPTTNLAVCISFLTTASRIQKVY